MKGSKKNRDQRGRYYAKSKMRSMKDRYFDQIEVTETSSDTNTVLQDDSVPYDNTKQVDSTGIPDHSESPFQEFEVPSESFESQDDITTNDNFEFQGDKPCYSI